MKLLHLTDIHSDFLSLQKVIEKETLDFAILSGDITHFGGKPELQKALEILGNSKTDFYAVTGNCDKPECELYLNETGYSLDCKLLDIGDYQIIGLSGSLPCPGATPNEFYEEEYQQKTENLERLLLPGKPIVFVTHQPPFKTKNDRVLMGFNVGSKSIRSFIEKYQPVVCLTGHIHEGKGIDYIGKTAVINPGPLKNGHYALIELTGENPPVIKLI